MKILSPATCIPPLDRLDYGVVPKNMQDRKQKMKWTKWLMFAVPVLAAAAVLSGCASYDNNYLRPEDFAAYLERDGVKVDGTRPLPGDPFRATSGCAIMIDGNEIGVYKYDRSSSVQEKRVEKIGDEGRTYIQGIPFPAEVRGSFMFLGLEKNPQKRRILEVIDKFY